MAIAVCELVTNALKHAFEQKVSGSVRIVFTKGVGHHTISVCDDGAGLPAGMVEGFGLQIVRATVTQKLHGNLSILSRGCGTAVTFDCKAE